MYLLVGEAPGPNGVRNLSVEVAARAAGEPTYLAFSQTAALRRFIRETDYVNLLPRWPGLDPEKAGSAFPADEAFRAAADLRIALRRWERRGSQIWCTWRGRTFRPPDLVLLAGCRVAAAFEMRGAPYFRVFGPRALGYVPFMKIPHPSGVSRWWNSRANRARALAEFELLGMRKRGDSLVG